MKNDDLKKRKRKRKDRDPDWTQARENLQNPRPVKRKKVGNLLSTMGVASPSPKKSIVIDNLASPLSSSKITNVNANVTLSTPLKGALTSKVFTPAGTVLKPKRSIQCDDGNITFFASRKKERSHLSLPEPNEWVKNDSPIPKASFKGVVDKKITRGFILGARWKKRERMLAGRGKRGKSQIQVMGNISARHALEKAGISVESGVAHWVHFVGHQFIDEQSQVPSNLGLALKWANGAMAQVEEEIYHILMHRNKAIRPEALYLTVIPEWVEEFKNIRLLKSITVQVKDKPGKEAKKFVSMTFDALLPEGIPGAETKMIQKVMRKKFLQKKPEASNVESEAVRVKSEAARELLFSSPLKVRKTQKENVENKAKSSVKPK